MKKRNINNSTGFQDLIITENLIITNSILTETLEHVKTATLNQSPGTNLIIIIES
jgi:hypothetical protein